MTIGNVVRAGWYRRIIVAATKKSSGTRGRGSGRAVSTGRATTKKQPTRAHPSRTRQQPAPDNGGSFATSLSDATQQHRGDLLGLAALALAIISGLGIYSDLAGPVGRAVEGAVGALFGVARFLFPIVVLVAGVTLMTGRSRQRRSVADQTTSVMGELDDNDQEFLADPSVLWTRRALGVGLIFIAGLGLIDTFRGRPGLNGSSDELLHAAGFLGAAIGSPLRIALSPIGAIVLLVAIAIAGLVLVTGRGVAQAAGATAEGMRPAGNAFVRLVRSMFQLDPQHGADSAADGEVAVVDFADQSDPSSEFSDDAPIAADAAHAGQPTTEIADVPDQTAVQEAPPTVFDQDAGRQSRDLHSADAAADAGNGETRQLEIELGPGARPTVWKLPPMRLLHRSAAQQVDKTAIKETGQTLEHALAEHGVETRLVGMTIGPTVTRYELELGPGVKVAKLTSLHKDIAYAMATPDVRILAPIPGRQAIGVEVPNARKQLVAVGDILASAEARAAKHPLEVAVGRDIAGKSVMANLATMPHVLIAGATGAGKSSCINTLMTSLLMRTTPDQVRMILVDPKRVELGQYNGLPHLLTEVVTNPKKAANALAWAVREMERRYDLLSEVGVRDITGYNAAFDRGDLTADPGSETQYERLPFIVIVVDELNDLMMVAARDVEESITRIAQMARAVGIHLIIATQRPSVNVITGVIKANIPARWAFAVSSLADSRVILDQPGAEKLLGKGDMLLLGPASSIPRRIQGSWVTEEEVRAAVGHWKRQSPRVSYDDAVQGSDDDASGSGNAPFGGGSSDDDELLVQAMELVVRSQLGSTSMLQRKLRVGFARAGRLMDLLEQRGVVGPSTGSKARTVLMTVEEFEGGPQASSGDDLVDDVVGD